MPRHFQTRSRPLESERSERYGFPHVDTGKLWSRVIDVSGLAISACAFAKALRAAPSYHLERCILHLLGNTSKLMHQILIACSNPGRSPLWRHLAPGLSARFGPFVIERRPLSDPKENANSAQRFEVLISTVRDRLRSVAWRFNAEGDSALRAGRIAKLFSAVSIKC